jgi:hypothetical protein
MVQPWLAGRGFLFLLAGKMELNGFKRNGQLSIHCIFLFATWFRLLLSKKVH